MNASIPSAIVTTELISEQQTSYVIVNLEAFTNYSIEVTAVTVGEGPYSTPIIVITDQEQATLTVHGKLQVHTISVGNTYKQLRSLHLRSIPTARVWQISSHSQRSFLFRYLTPHCVCVQHIAHYSDASTALFDSVHGEEHWYHISARSCLISTFEDCAHHYLVLPPEHLTSVGHGHTCTHLKF